MEDAVISTARVHGVEAGRWSAERGLTEARDESRPGVWTSRDGKLCSVGIHFRRGVSSFGLGFNVTDEVGVWFERIVACGIPDARAVSLMGERSRVGRDGVVGVDDVAVTLAQVIADGLDGVEGVEVVDCRELGEMDD